MQAVLRGSKGFEKHQQIRGSCRKTGFACGIGASGPGTAGHFKFNFKKSSRNHQVSVSVCSVLGFFTRLIFCSFLDWGPLSWLLTALSGSMAVTSLAGISAAQSLNKAAALHCKEPSAARVQSPHSWAALPRFSAGSRGVQSVVCSLRSAHSQLLGKRLAGAERRRCFGVQLAGELVSFVGQSS